MQELKLGDDPWYKPMTEEDMEDMKKNLNKIGKGLILLGCISIACVLFRLVRISLFAVLLFIPVGILTFVIR